METTTLKFWDNQQTQSGPGISSINQYHVKAVKIFEAENPGITVEVTTIPYPEYWENLKRAVKRNNLPDVFTVDQIWNSDFAKVGAIDKLDDRAKADGIKSDEFFKGAWDSANYNGGLWGIPFNVDVWFFCYYNKQLLQKAGIDRLPSPLGKGLEKPPKS